jgi:hypothetical protein
MSADLVVIAIASAVLVAYRLPNSPGSDGSGFLLIISIDDVATGLLVNAISAAGRWLGTAAAATRSGRGRAAEDLAAARWFETYKLTSRTPDLSRLSDKSAERLRALLSGDDAQAAVQELLAVRLTDGSNQDAGRARQAFVLSC